MVAITLARRSGRFRVGCRYVGYVRTSNRLGEGRLARRYPRQPQAMTVPAGMTDLFPAFSLGGVALIGLMARIAPPPAIRWSVVAALAAVLALYLSDQLHLWLPDRFGLPLYGALLLISGTVLLWNWRTARATRRR